MLDQLRAERLHGAILFAAVAVRDDDGCGQSPAAGRKSYALAVVAASGCDDAGEVWLVAHEPIHVNSRAAQLEGADGRVILMLEPDLGACALIE